MSPNPFVRRLPIFLPDSVPILRALDLEGFKRLCVEGGAEYVPSDEVCLASLHKCRYDCIALTMAERQVSRKWLELRGLGPLFGTFSTDGSLPE